MNRASIWAVAAVSVVLTAPLAVRAADAYKAGAEVDVFFLNKWWPGTVIDTNKRGEVMVEYEFAGRPQRKIFKATEVRSKFEVGALSKLRQWSDATGQFKIQAVLLSSDGQQVTLRKPDMTEIKVPLSKLSTTDQSFVKRLETEAAKSGSSLVAQTITGPPVEQFATAAPSSAPLEGPRTAITPDPVPGYLVMKEGGAVFPNEDVFDRIGAVVPIGGKDGWILAAVENTRPSEPKPTRLLWCSLERNKIEGRQLLPPGEIVLDYHAPSRRLLSLAQVKSEGDTRGRAALTLWEVLPTDKAVKPVIRWDAATEKGWGFTPWARVIQGDLVIQRYTKTEYVLWDATQKEMRYRITQESFFAPEPTLSGGRKYLFLPEDKAIRVFECATGQLACQLPAPNGASAVAVTSDGRKAAVLNRTQLTVHDLTDANAEPELYQAEAIGTSFGTHLSWIGDDRVMAETGLRGQVLYSLTHKVALWNYQIDVGTVEGTQGRRLREVANDHLVYAAAVREGTQRGYAVGAVSLPGPKVDEAVGGLDIESLMILKPGSAVRLEVRAGDNNSRVQAALERAVAANGWTVSPAASAVVIAEMKRGETQQVTYRLFGPGGGRDETASVTPYISTLRIEVDGSIAWQTGTSSGAPPVVRLGEGQSAQDEVNRWQKPNVEFFEGVAMPERILDPGKRMGLGTTQVTNRGLVVK